MRSNVAQPGENSWGFKKTPDGESQGKLKTVRKYREEITCTKNENFIAVAAVAYPM